MLVRVARYGKINSMRKTFDLDNPTDRTNFKLLMKRNKKYPKTFFNHRGCFVVIIHAYLFKDNEMQRKLVLGKGEPSDSIYFEPDSQILLGY